MRLSELTLKLLDLCREYHPDDPQVTMISESQDDYPALKIWAHPGSPDSDTLNPEIVIK